MTAGGNWKPQPPEFVALILAGTTGSRLFPLTVPSSNPKHMLPVGGESLLHRLVQNLQAVGFTDAVVAVSNDDAVTRKALFVQQRQQQLPQQQPNSKHVNDPSGGGVRGDKNLFLYNNMNITVVDLKTECSSSMEALRRVEAAGVVSERSNLFVVSGDLVMLDLQPIREMLHRHRMSESAAPVAACTVLLTDVGEVDEHGHPLKESAKQKKGLLARDEEEIDYVAVSAKDGRLAWRQPKLEVEEDRDMVGATPKFVIPKARLRGSTVTVRTEWSDVHCYCLAPWVRQLVRHRTGLQSIRNDLIPLLVSRQFRGIAATFGSAIEKDVVDDALLLVQDNSNNNNTDNALDPGTVALPLLSESTWMAPSPAPPNHPGTGDATDEYTVLAHIAPKSVFRSHTVPAYLYANRELAHQVSALAAVHSSTPRVRPVPLMIPPGAAVKPKFHTVLMADCDIGDKVTFKSCIIGRSCRVGAKSRLNNVVLQDHVVIGENAILQNTVVGRDSHIGENCNLNDCQVATGVRIAAGTKKKGDAITESDALL
jgi:NDP-sugar pyrophosphorylase family protein